MKLNAIRTEDSEIYSIWLDGDKLIIDDLKCDSIQIRVDVYELLSSIGDVLGQKIELSDL